MAETDPNIVKWHELCYQVSYEDAQLRLGYADAYAHAALKYLFLMNGASIVSLLTLVGNSNTSFNKNKLFLAFVFFAIGLFKVIIAYFSAYLCQNFYMKYSFATALHEKMQALNFECSEKSTRYLKFGNIMLFSSIATSILSLFIFVSGAFSALAAIT